MTTVAQRWSRSCNGRGSLRSWWLQTAGSLLCAAAKRALTGARILWQALPRSVRGGVSPALRWKGLAYVFNYLATYDEIHDLDNFAGNLVVVHQRYADSSAEEKERLANRFDKIMDSLVLANGVQKTTYRLRQHKTLAKVLRDERCRPQRSALTVLDVPSSSGVAALDSFALLSQYYPIRAYVLGDLSFHIIYDTDRECVFDEDRNLLQVKLGKRFFSIHRGHRSGDVYTPFARVLLLLFEVVAWYLKKKYPYSAKSHIARLSLIHPEVAVRLRTGDFSVRSMDVFRDIGDSYDLILSFNLLQRNYFPREQIVRGLENFTNALHEGGFLIVGNDECFSVAQKREEHLVVIKEEGVHGTIGGLR